MVQKASPKLTEMMNQAIAGELQAIVQYMWHHIMVKGMTASSLMDVFEDISVEEMKHAEKIVSGSSILMWFPQPSRTLSLWAEQPSR